MRTSTNIDICDNDKVGKTEFSKVVVFCSMYLNV